MEQVGIEPDKRNKHNGKELDQVYDLCRGYLNVRRLGSGVIILVYIGHDVCLTSTTGKNLIIAMGSPT